MNFLVLFLFLCGTLAVSSLEQGESCSVDNGGRGICTKINNCQPVIDQLMAGHLPTKLCGYHGFDPVVCCPTSTGTTTAPTSRPDTGDRIGDGRGQISKQKCREYAQYVYTLKYPATLTFNRQPINVSECATKSQKLIVGGTKAEQKEFPHSAAIGYNLDDGTIGWRCGGTLISETFVLTAAHCFSSSIGPPVRVRVGDLNLVRTDDGATPVERRISQRIKHPNYKPPAQYHDIGLLRLESRVNFNGWIRPACLHTAPSTGTQKSIATGWGRVDWDEDDGSNDLLKVTLPLVDHSTCNGKFRGGGPDGQLPDGIVDDWMICAGEVGKDTCQGDSGGPLVVFSKPEYHCMYDVVGVTSLGRLCGSTIPGVYTRVYQYISWIERTVWG